LLHHLCLGAEFLPTYRHPLWDKFDLYPYQYRILDLKEPFVMNVPTGFGKTFAAIIPSIVDRTSRTFFVFPSNALVETQYNSMKSNLRKWKLDFSPLKLTGDELLKYMVDENYETKGKALYDLITQHERNVIFTNLDIMFNIISMKYARRFKKDIVSTLRASRIIIDEFHFYKNVGAVLLGAIYKLLLGFTENVSFLSATPCNKTLNLLHSIRVLPNVVTHNEEIEGKTSPQQEVVHPTTLSVRMPQENLVEEAFNWLVKKYDKERIGMAILDSIRDSVVLHKKLKESNVKTFLYTGLLKDPVPQKIKKGIIVGTSAIEVGIDRDINFLFFQARNRTSFMQRFGRVGRHSEGDAYAVVHPDIYKQLRSFPSSKTLPRLKVLDSISGDEYRFNYRKLFFNSEFSSIVKTLLKLYYPDARLSIEEKQVLRDLKIRDNVSVFVLGGRDGERVLSLYDVLRVLRDYKIEKIYFSKDAEEKVEELDTLSQQKFRYHSKFCTPSILEIDNFYQPHEGKLMIRFEEPKIFHPPFCILDIIFGPLIQRGLVKPVINNRQVIEEGCVTTQDWSDKQKVWVWGYSSKLVEGSNVVTII